MIPETDRLLEQLAEFRQNRHAVGHQQPKFTAWVDAVRHWLSFRDDREALQSFEQLRLARVTGGMWRRDEASGAEVRELLAELDQVEALLRAAARSDPSPADPPGGGRPNGAEGSSGGGKRPHGAEAGKDRG
ncbi:MAG: hypothetical protein IH608_09335, partial [Proteobacteria bacterium]|nr:hypothetical protein [Pseudomonadota bacterium]